jgi:hypothetical protein
MRRRASVQAAFDAVRFGPTRILNLREALPSGAEATRRAEGWLRAKQLERAGEVLVITGRGSASVGGIPVIRTQVLLLLTSLRRRGVVSEVTEHTAGSFVVRLAPLRALFEAPARNREQQQPLPPPLPQTLKALSGETQRVLRVLATRALESLGMQAPSRAMVSSEMERQFALLSRGVPAGIDADMALRRAADAALDEYDASDR